MIGTRRTRALLIAALLTLAGAHSSSAQSAEEAAAFRVLDEQMAAYNASDERAWLAALHYPHVRISGSSVRVFATPESYLPELSFQQHGWDFSRWTERRVVQSGPEKVHVLATFARYRANRTELDRFEALYVIAFRSGRWGIVARSSF